MLCKILESRDIEMSWGLDKGCYTGTALKLFDKYIKQFDHNLWSATDFNLYRYYHTLKKLDDIKENLNSKIIQFWKKNNIELLCAQSIEMHTNSLHAFKISDVVDEIFGNKNDFLKLIRSQTFTNRKAGKEFLDFFNLCELTNFNQFLKFNFKSSELMKERIDQNANIIGRSNYDEYVNITQVIFETNIENIYDKFRMFLDSYSIRKVNYIVNNKQYHIILDFNSDDFEKNLLHFSSEIFKLINKEIADMEYKEENILKKEKYIFNNRYYYLKLISIQK